MYELYGLTESEIRIVEGETQVKRIGIQGAATRIANEKGSYQMKNTIAVLFVLLLVSFGRAQQRWTKTYGGTGTDEGNCVQQTSDGGYIVSGTTFTFGAGGADVYLIKTNASGDTVWTRTYGGTDDEYGNSVQQTSDGDYIVAGSTASFGAGGADVYLIKTNASGDTVWTRTYGGPDDEYGTSIQQTSDGGYIVAVSTAPLGGGITHIQLIKTNASGDTVWTRTYGGTGGEVGHSVRQTSDGGYILTGLTLSFGGPEGDVYLMKTNASGDTLWTRTYGGTRIEEGYSVRQTTDGGYIVAGYTNSFGGARNSDAYLIKTNASGDTLWTRIYGATDYDVAGSVQQTSDGGYIVAGWADSDYPDVWLIKTNASGDSLWTKNYGASEPDYGYSVQQTTDGGYIITGCANLLYLTQSSVYLIKTDANGDVGEE